MIRDAQSKDKTGIGKVLAASYNIASAKEGEQIFLHESKAGIQYLVAEEDRLIAGIASWIMHGLPKHGLAELDRIAALPEFRGKGIANLLMDGIIACAQKKFAKQKARLRKLYLLTHADNQRAQAFYKKLGFVHETTLKSHFYKDKDEWVMSKFFG